MFAPKSPGLQGTGHLLQRMNSIAPGPFDPNKSSRYPARGDSAKQLQPAPVLNEQKAVSESSHSKTPSEVSSNHSRSSTTSSLRAGPPRLEKLNGYVGFGPPDAQDENSLRRDPINRAQTFPRENTRLEKPDSTLLRRPSEPTSSVQSSPRQEKKDFTFELSQSPENIRPTTSSGRNPSTLALPSHSEDFRTRKASGSDNSSLAVGYSVGNPYHTPNLSQSSNGSGMSLASITSSRSSPPSDVGLGRRKGSDNGTVDALARDLSKMPAQRVQTSPPKVSPKSATQAPVREQWAKGMPPPRFDVSTPESPMDPAVQDGYFTRPPPRSENRPAPQRSVTLPTPTPKRPVTAKGNCKGCSEPIKGKSVSSADGRLTGRYHKACFVCKTCSEPFATATFYVLNDSPYCERHYHQLNNSMCKTCDRGIEGQYLETERRTKYHPHCLTCSDCKTILRHDYFEMNGRVYCERDAMRRATQRNMANGGGLNVPGQTNRMERRTTRLMMI